MKKKNDVQFLVEILNITNTEAEQLLATEPQKAIDILWENSEWYEQEHNEIVVAFGDRLEKVRKTALNDIPKITHEEMKKRHTWLV